MRNSDRRSSGRRLERIIIECVSPAVDGGRHAVKRVTGDTIWIGADVIKEGHDLLGARILYKNSNDRARGSARMWYDFDSDRWYGSFVADTVGQWAFTVEAWTDAFATWRDALKKKVAAGQDVQL